MSAEEFLNRLEQQGLLDGKVVASLRTQVARAGAPISADKIANLLVQKGRLTSAQAEQLLAPPSADDELDLSKLMDAPDDDDDSWSTLAVSDNQPSIVEDVDEDVVEEAYDDDDATVMASGAMDGNEGAYDGPSHEYAPDPGGGYDEYADPMGTAGGMDAMNSPIAGGSRRGFRGKKLRVSWAQSKWIFIGTTLVIFLFMAVGVLVFALTQGSAQEMFDAAEQSYRNESYSEAIDRYQKFLERYPSDENASKAAVKHVLAELRLPIAANNWNRGLEIAETKLLEIEQETAFADARAELRSLLPDIAEGFAEKGTNAETTEQMEELVALAERGMELVNNPTYLPTSERQNPTIASRIESIEEAIKLVHREINKEKDLRQALVDIRKANEQGQTEQAFVIRMNLLRTYPSLESNPHLHEVVLEITGAEQALVRVVSQPLASQSEPLPSASQSSVTIVNRIGKSAEAAAGGTAIVLAAGAVYAIDALTGEFRWRQFVGYETTEQPEPVSTRPGADLIVVNGRRNELMRLKRNNGKLVWRLPVGEEFSAPTVGTDQAYITTRSGRLLQVNLETGQVAKQVQFPQPLQVSPGVTDKQPYLYQTGEHSNLYVLSATELMCREVAYLGHQAGTIAVPPIMTGDYLILIENAGDGFAVLRVLVAQERGLNLRPLPQQVFRMKGHVVRRPRMYGPDLLVVTDEGEIHVFQLLVDKPESPLALMVKSQATGKRMTRYSLLDEDSLWVAGEGFTKYRLLMTNKSLQRQWRKDQFDTFVAPVQQFGNVIVHTRRRNLRRESSADGGKGPALDPSPGVSVAGISADNGEEIWRTDVGVPIIDASKRQVVAISAHGKLYEINAKAIQSSKIDKPSRLPSATEKPLWFTQLTPLADGRLALTGLPHSDELLSYDPKQGRNSLKLKKLQMHGAQATAQPTHFANGLLVPLSSGRVLHLDVETGGDRTLPFQPPSQPGQNVTWQRPAVVGNGDQFVIADSRRTIYRVAVVDSPEPHLAAVGQAELTSDIASPLAAVGKTVYGVSRGDSTDYLLSYQLPDLELDKQQPLDARVVWGPEQVDDSVILTTDAGQLICFGQRAEVRWTSPLSYGPLAGLPLKYENDLVFAAQNGTIWRVAGDSGQEVAAIQLDQPCGSGPVELSGRLWIYASDGTLHLIPVSSISRS